MAEVKKFMGLFDVLARRFDASCVAESALLDAIVHELTEAG